MNILELKIDEICEIMETDSYKNEPRDTLIKACFQSSPMNIAVRRCD